VGFVVPGLDLGESDTSIAGDAGIVTLAIPS
jgi:hypothetical protein